MPSLQDQDQGDQFSKDSTDTDDQDGMYDDGECWGYKAQTLEQIIGGSHCSMLLANDTPTLYTFCLHRYTKVNMNSELDNGETDFHQARE